MHNIIKMLKKRTTLKDIAEKLGISVATVSRALKNHPEISQRIKDQVNLLVSSMNYRPNSFALHLKNQQSRMIGVVLPKVVHYHSSTILKGIIAKCHDLNYQVLICESGIDAASEIILSPAGDLAEAATGLFAAMRNLDAENIDLILAERFPEDGIGLAINDRLERAAHGN